ncbi:MULTISPECIES: methylated-DNA--[protein]-cysteine S-methyltransferase [Paraburkholderia]|uniref:methylated-DNA--[protein]-cysteine S-methyltransferase n=1 Tax=Paraburkholderia TaxID=1822464 RepID=UPI000B3F6635
MYLYKRVASPVGILTLVAEGPALTAILWQNERPGRVRLGPMREAKDDPVLTSTECQLSEYFTGGRERFDLPLAFSGTEFQKKVWNALLSIPYGETRTYGDIAKQIGQPTAVRAVGAANGRNPVSIIAPCHRVIGSAGQLTGFAGGLPAKEVLLTLEGAQWGSRSSARLVCVSGREFHPSSLAAD